MLDFYLKKTEDTKALNLNIKPPPLPYTKKNHKTLDGFWLNKQKGSSLSYFSSCSQVPRSLKAFQSSSYPSDLNYTILKRVETSKSIESLLEIPSTKTHIAIHTVKNKSCFFNINLVAPSQKVLEEEMPLFQNFITNFKAL